MTELRLYFGRDIPGGGFVTDQAWLDFSTRSLTPAFPDGLTAYGALGQWRNPLNGRIVREHSFVVEVEGRMSPAKVAAVVQDYRTAFHQIAVGQVSENVCGAF